MHVINLLQMQRVDNSVFPDFTYPYIPHVFQKNESLFVSKSVNSIFFIFIFQVFQVFQGEGW